MGGFFSKQEAQLSSRPDGKTYSCFSCGLYRAGCTTPKMKARGGFEKEILNIFDYPSEAEDKKGKIPYSAEGKYLSELFQKQGINLRTDCLNTSAVKCSPVDRAPTDYEISCCRIHLIKLVKKYKPKLILVHGELALKGLIGHRYPDAINNIDKWRGFLIPDQELQCFIAPMYNLSYVLSKNQISVYTIYKADLENALSALISTFPKHEFPNIKVIKKLDVLNEIKSGVVSFDYETTGLKPHANGHRIVCCSVATGPNDVYVFMMPKNKELREPFINLLRNRGIKKMAHNMKFEEMWSFNYLGTRVKNWYWDSMLAAHILDNRNDITGLKFQTYVNFGVIDYSSDVAKWLQSTEDSKNANSKNKILDLIYTSRGKDQLLEYCALDSIFEYRLALKQQKEMKNILPF